MKCKKCGYVNESSARYCEKCGNPLIGNSAKKTKWIICLSASVVLIALMISVMMIREPEDKSYNSILEEAQRYYVEMQYSEAEALCLEAINIDPKQAGAYLTLIDVYVDTAQLDKARELVETAKSQVSDDQSQMILSKESTIPSKYLEADESDFRKLDEGVLRARGMPYSLYDKEDSENAVYEGIDYDLDGKNDSFIFGEVVFACDWIYTYYGLSVDQEGIINTIPEILAADPLNRFMEINGEYYYVIINGDKMDEMLTNLFSLEPAHSLDTERAYYYDGNYYIRGLYQPGGPNPTPHTHSRRRLEDGRYELWVNFVVEYGERSEPYLAGTRLITVGLKEIDGKKQWQIDKIGPTQ